MIEQALLLFFFFSLIAGDRMTNATTIQLFLHLLFRQNCYFFPLENIRIKSWHFYSVIITVTELYVLLYIKTGEHHINNSVRYPEIFQINYDILQRT